MHTVTISFPSPEDADWAAKILRAAMEKPRSLGACRLGILQDAVGRASAVDITEQLPRGTLNDWAPEVTSLLERLAVHGFVLRLADNGEETFAFRGSIPEMVEHLIACDESHLHVFNSVAGRRSSLFLVLGNSPGELVCNYSGGDAALETVLDEHYTAWDGKPQPTKIDQIIP